MHRYNSGPTKVSYCRARRAIGWRRRAMRHENFRRKDRYCTAVQGFFVDFQLEPNIFGQVFVKNTNRNLIILNF